MTSPIVGGLVEQSTVERRVETGVAPGWIRDHWSSFRDGLLGERNDSPFPCFFGVESVRNGEPFYTAVPSTSDPDALLALGDVLLDYLERRREEKPGASLVAFFQPPERDLTEAEYHDCLWHVLQFLHVHDPDPWPADIPTDTDDPYWEFCFGGEPIFPTCRAPFYQRRKSRYCPVGLEVTFQPRALFEDLDVTADSDWGEEARERIHDRLEEYDGVCPHADIGDWGVEGDREWHQYMLSEDDSQAPDACPLTATREHPKATLLCGSDASPADRARGAPAGDRR